MDNPFVSVIVPVYNVQDYVAECLLSLMEQTYLNFEVVCVNDGSTDNSREILTQFERADYRFRIIDRENGGLSAARNTGLDHARGTYVCFLDSDDKYEPFALEHMANAAKEDDLDLVDFDSATFYESDTVRQIHQEGTRERDDIPGVMSGAALLSAYEERGQYFPSACYHLIRRAALDKAGLRFEEGLLHEDELFTPLLHAYMGPSRFLNEKLYLRRLRSDSIMTVKRTTKNIVAEFLIASKLTQWLQDHCTEYDDRFLHAFAQHIYLLEDFMCHEALNFTEDELREAAKDMQPQDRVLFELVCVQNRNGIARMRSSYEDSKSYKLGLAVTALPRALRSMGKK